ncbi:MAG: response regulator transcription factor, partial [Actinomycetota bacterium]
GVGGIEATRRLKQAMADIMIVVLTVSDEDHHLFEALKGGAQGYLLKSIKPEKLLDSLRGIMQGEQPFSPSIADQIIKEFSSEMQRASKTPEEARVTLTPREQRILMMVSDGATNKQIAEALFVAESTVKNHLHNILKKLHLQNRVQAAVYAMREGLITNPDAKKE